MDSVIALENGILFSDAGNRSGVAAMKKGNLC